VADLLAPDAVLLPCEGKGGKGGSQKIRNWAGKRSDGASANPHGQVAKTKEVVEDGIRAPKVLAGAQQKKIADGQGVGFGSGEQGSFGVGQGHDVSQERHGQRLDA
jgi:hypothetical protein